MEHFYAITNCTIILRLGGYVYSIKENPWAWLTSKEAAETMAEEVAHWPRLYNCDGINLDLEDGAGSRFKIHQIFYLNILTDLIRIS